MATTTNYGWSTPDDTALVKDGASAIRSLGTSIDTTTKNLNPSTTLGDIEYRSSTANTNTRLAIGSAGQVLTVSSGVPAWTTLSSGGMTLIQESVASAISSLSFSSIAGTYKQLFLVWSGIYHSAANNGFSVRLNNSSSSIYYEQGAAVYGGNATSQYVQGTGIGISLGIQSGSYLLGYDTSDYPSNLQLQCQGSLLIDNYASTTKYKYYKADFSYFDGGIGALATNIYGVFASTSAITSVDIFRGTGSGTFSNYTDTSIRLYGVS